MRRGSVFFCLSAFIIGNAKAPRRDDPQAIIAENLDDYNLMSRTLNNQEHQGGRNLRLNLSILDASTPALADFEKPWTDEEVDFPPDHRALISSSMLILLFQLKSRGFDCWAIDLVEGPDEVLRYLCQVSNLHRIVRTSPVALSIITLTRNFF